MGTHCWFFANAQNDSQVNRRRAGRADAQNDKNKTFRMTDDSGGEILKEFRRHFPKLIF